MMATRVSPETVRVSRESWRFPASAAYLNPSESASFRSAQCTRNFFANVDTRPAFVSEVSSTARR